ncbi:hypothetical protein Scep_028415 [Stephania cephalantha]|uniref:CBS domain-containing protein n=1 Tax=Stephania cephalantha TaxID=152367 RepID=A0AAP0EH89_9MAGN
MAVSVWDLCLGKPPLTSLSENSATVGDALSALKASGEDFVSVWSCDHRGRSDGSEERRECRCVGKVCVVDVICYLCRCSNVDGPGTGDAVDELLRRPVSVVVREAGVVRHVDPHSSLVDAINLMLEGAQNLVVPIESIERNVGSTKSKKKFSQKSSICSTNHNGREFCWLTQEDIVRYLLSSIGFFSPLPALSIESLGIIKTDGVLAVRYDDPASSTINAISNALVKQTAVAVVDEEGKLIGEISPLTLASCDERVMAAIAVLSVGDLMAYIDYGGPPEYILQEVKVKLREKGLDGMLALLGESPVPASPHPSSASEEDDEESSSVLRSSTRKYGKSGSFSGRRMVRSADAIVCHPGSSLVAVMMKTLAYRVNYIWVIEDDCSLAGIVTFSDILKVFREQLETISK